jgi:hypoxanthine phosphoribosyltransferase
MLNTMKVLFDEQTIARRVAELGKVISKDYGTEGVVVICVLKGAAIFTADLVRKLTCPVDIEFIGCSSYVGTQSTGTVRITNDLTADIEGRRVLLVEDIVDTGRTVDYLCRFLQQKNPASVDVAALLVKPEAHEVPVQIRYHGFSITKEFVIGYGLDLDGKYRELPYVAQLN